MIIAQIKGFEIDLKEFFGNGGLDGLCPDILFYIGVFGAHSEKHQIYRLGGSCLLGEGKRVESGNFNSLAFNVGNDTFGIFRITRYDNGNRNANQ